ncbi:MAG: hypothetical protein JNM28_13175 [Armatimonadetes bacterium]|nr:hypothetical protein [Armatimonadota bacterium]
MRWLFWGFALALAAPVSAAGGMVFTDTINNVRPDHPSLAGTFWGWTFHSNLNSSQVTLPYVTRVNEVADTSTYLTLSTWDDSSAFNNPSLPGRGGYMVFDRHDTSIDFTLGSTIRAQILRMGCHASTATSPVPGMMIGLQDKRGRFFAIGLGWDFIDHYVRIINNPFTGAGTNWVKLTTSTNFYYLSGIRQGLTMELVVAG